MGRQVFLKLLRDEILPLRDPRVRDNEAIATAVTNRMLKIDGIVRTETLIAFRAYSRYNLERMFTVGLEEPPPAAD